LFCYRPKTVGPSGSVQTVSIYNNPLLATTSSSQPSQPVWKLPKKPRKQRRPKITLQSDQQVDPIVTDKPVNSSNSFTEQGETLSAAKPRAEELEFEDVTNYTRDGDNLFSSAIANTNSDLHVNLEVQETDLQVNPTDEQKDKLAIEAQVLNNRVEEKVHFKVQDSDFMSVQVCLEIRIKDVTL
jgi:hypothetical protein